MSTDEHTNSIPPAPDGLPNRRDAAEIFSAARALGSEAEREAFLKGACAGDGELRARVEALLRADADAGSFLADRKVPASTAGMPGTERAGQIIGRYKLLQRIGEGGFGSVFLAAQSEPVRRRVALKIIKPGMDSRMVAARFEAERQALALMDHPHIARVFDGGVTDAAMGARPYFVMEYVIGDPVTTFADAHTLSITDRLVLFTQVCEAVQHAHNKGVIHRDLKPSNVLVSMTDGRPFAKVIDFGIAKATSSPLTEKTLFTEHRQLIGTPEYMSPEQAEGSPDIDTRADVYALGVLLYELLTGTTPFDAKRLRSAAFAEMQRIIKEEEPPAPSVRLQREVGVLAATAAARQVEPARLGTMLRREPDWMVMKALDKDRARRYESPSRFAEDVRRYLAGEAVMAAPAGLGYRVRKFVRRHRGAVAGAGTVTAAILIGGGLAAWQWRVATSANERLVLKTAESEEQAKIVRDELVRVVKEFDPGTIASSHTSNGPGIPPTKNEWVNLRRKDGSPGTYQDQVKFMAEIALEAFAKEKVATDAAEFGAYTANLLLAQAAMDRMDWPEARQRLAACPQSQRGWEWQFLQNKASIVEWQTLGWSELNPAGTRLLTINDEAPDNSYVQLRDISGRPVVRIPVLDGHGYEAHFSPDGARLLTVAYGSGEPGSTAVAHWWDSEGRSVGQAMRMPQLATYMYCVHDGRGALAVSMHPSGIGAIATWWDEGGALVGHPMPQEEDVTEVALSPDGRCALIACRGGVAKYWDRDGRPIGKPMRHVNPVRFAEFSVDGERLVTLSDEAAAHLWDRGGMPVGEPMTHGGRVCSASFSPDGQFIVTTSDDGSVHFWDRDGRPVWQSTVDAQAPVTRSHYYRPAISDRPQFNIDGDIAVPLSNFVAILDKQGNRLRDLLQELPDPGDCPGVSLVLSPNGRTQLTWFGNTLRLWDSSGRLIGTAALPDREHALDATFAPDGSAIVVTTQCTHMEAARTLVLRPALHSADSWTSSHVAFRESMASAADTEESIAHSSGAAVAAIGPDGRVITPGLPGAIPDGVRDTLRDFEKPVRALTQLRDGSRVVTGEQDGTIRFWDTNTWRQVAQMRVDGSINALACAADGKRLFIELADGGYLWDARTPEEQAEGERQKIIDLGVARKHVAALLAGPSPTEDLTSILRSDTALTRACKAIAFHELEYRIWDINHAVDEEANNIFRQFEHQKPLARNAAQEAALPARIKAKVIEKVDAWVEKP